MIKSLSIEKKIKLNPRIQDYYLQAFIDYSTTLGPSKTAKLTSMSNYRGTIVNNIRYLLGYDLRYRFETELSLKHFANFFIKIVAKQFQGYFNRISKSQSLVSKFFSIGGLLSLPEGAG